jgi:hypothetical protein
MAIGLQEATRRLPESKILWNERFGFYREPCFRGLIPDYAFLIRHRLDMNAYLVEVSSGEESITRFRQKLIAYELWIESEASQQFLVELYRKHGAQQPRPQFRLLCVMHNRRDQRDDIRLRDLVYAAADVPTKVRRKTWCTTAQAIIETADISAPIWLRLKDLEPAFQASEGAPRRQLHRQLANAQQLAPRRSLFPIEVAP